MKKLLPIITFFLLPSFAFAAITRDNYREFSPTTNTSQTDAYTVSGTNTILFVGIIGSLSSNAITGVTYAGSAMTKINSVQAPTNRWIDLFYKIAPTTGSNNIVVSSSPSDYIQAVATSYDGVSQTGFPDASTTVTSASESSATISVTTTADNTWLVGEFDATGGGGVAGSNTNFIAATSTNVGQGIWDSNGANTPPGSHSMAATFTSDPFAGIMVSIAPVAVAATPTASILSLIRAQWWQ